MGNMSAAIREIFLRFSDFLRDLSLKSFGNLLGNSHTQFAILDIMLWFTCC